MTQRIIGTTVYTLDSHPNQDACFDWIRNNWHNLNDHTLEEATASAEALALRLDFTVDYSIGGRGEYITFDCRGASDRPASDYADYISEAFLSGNCPLTGVCYDENLLDAFREADDDATIGDVLEEAGSNLLRALTLDSEYTYSEEGLTDMCNANEYEFTLEGEIV